MFGGGFARHRCQKPSLVFQATSDSGYYDIFPEEKITIEIPYGYTQRDQLLQFLESKFPSVEISLIHSEVREPQVSETLVEYDFSTQPATAEPARQREDATTVMQEVNQALPEFDG